MNQFWREPLVHFLIIGAGLFLAFDYSQDDRAEAPNRIVVNSSQIEQLAAQFERTWLRPPSEAEVAGLIEGYVRDEVYYREALAMGLDQNDPQVRRRMRLKLEFILEDLTAAEPPGDGVLRAFLQQHPEKFRVEPRLSFRQVYLNPDKRRDLAADAEKKLADLRAGASPETLGDPTLLPDEQTSVSQSGIARTFGETFAQELVALQPDAWAGPLYSGLGAHLVLVTERRDERLPALAEVRGEVEREYLAQRRQELKDAAYRKLREGYEVIVETATAPVDPAGAVATVAEKEPAEK